MRKAETRRFVKTSRTVALLGSLAFCSPLVAQSQQEQSSQAPSTQPPAPRQPGQVQLPGAPPQALQIPDTQSAPPFTVRDKFDYRVVQSFGLRGFVGAAISAGFGQGIDSPHEW